jgi:hypothetical protein
MGDGVLALLRIPMETGFRRTSWMLALIVQPG